MYDQKHPLAYQMGQTILSWHHASLLWNKKRTGIAVDWILQLLLVLPFSDLRIYQLHRASEGLPHRSTFYEFLAQTTYNWRRFILMVSQRLIEELQPLTSPSQDRVLIVDDSPYKRDRSKKVEYLGRRCVAATSKATDQTLNMVDRALKAGVRADYLVFDSWFAHPSLLHKLSQHLPVVCMLKNSGKISFRNGKCIYPLKGLYEKVAGRKRSKTSNTHQILGSILVDMLSGPKVRIVFLRERRNPEQWLALASTDPSLTPERICRIYAKRWAIEVFFKQAKQQLGLAREFQVRSYGAQIAHTSIVLLRYMMLEYYRRQCCDERTIPGLFHAYVQELQMLTVHVCIQLVLLEVLQLISRQGQGYLLVQVIELVGRFYQTHPWLQAFACEQERITLNSES